MDDKTNLTNYPNQPPLDEMARLSLAAREALTDNMVERLAMTGGNVLELLDRLNDPDTSAAVQQMIDRLTELHKVGAIDTICELALLVHGARSALTDNMVERLFMFMESMINTVGNEAMGELAENTRVAFEEAAQETAQAKPSGGIRGMMSMLSKPETQKSLAFLLAFSSKLQAASGKGPVRA
ncbi:MAG TPA: DUF1641 domain-containing protein [Pseudolabrys sp.]|jgi:uncharacterized protein YjgD (DUF1641 family)|nr:DUF1641 domain-containing protein [Pseudolabrys sp.]